MQVKTITTTAGVNEIDFGNDGSQSTAHFYWLKNLGSSTLYVSANPNPVAEKDDVAELPAKSAVSVETDEGKIYVLGAGKVEIHRTNSKFCPFDWQSSGSGEGGGGSITVDSELSDTSTNPLQNKVTTAAINEVNSALETKSDINHTHDISASGNPIIMDNLQGGVPFSEMVVSGKNLIVPKSVSRSVNGINFTVNSDKSITINGTSTSGTSFMIGSAVLNKNEKYTLSILSESKGINIHIGSGDDFSNPYDYTTTAKTITANSEDNTIWLWVPADRTLDNVIVYPQLELGDTATAYEPPIMGRELQVNVSGKNLLKYPYNETTKTVNGITFTDNGDGTITANGTATANAAFLIDKNFGFEKEGNYFLSGCPSGGGLDSFYINWYQNHTGVTIKNYNDYGSGIIIPYQHIFSENNSLAISIIAGATVENLVFHPQLELGDTATEYEPYHGNTTTITPTSNPYTIPNGISQQDGYNVASVSEGELSVVGVQKNAAIKRIWDDMGMDLLFDGVTSADNPAVVNLAKYNMIRIDVSGNYKGTTYFNCGSTYLSKSTLDFAFESYGGAMIPASNQAIAINISKSGTEYSLSFSGFGGKQLVDDIKIYGIK